jgi:hypothetical protein
VGMEITGSESCPELGFDNVGVERRIMLPDTLFADKNKV